MFVLKLLYHWFPTIRLEQKYDFKMLSKSLGGLCNKKIIAIDSYSFWSKRIYLQHVNKMSSIRCFTSYGSLVG